jgi:methylmalonyl-CoA mutase
VFLANLGPLAAHTGRTSFAGNLFAAGGIANIPSPSDLDPGRLAAAFTASGTTVACLCGTDKLYRQQAAGVAGALRAAGATKVWLAGAPGDYDGVDAYLYPGCDAVDVLATTLRDLGVGR